MRNPNRTTKPERRLIRRRNPTMSRILGVAQAARWHRDGFLLDEAKAFENMAADVLYGRPPADLDDRVMRVLAVTPNYTEATGYTVEPDGWINLHYPSHISLGADGAAAGEALAAAWEGTDTVTLHDCDIAPCGWKQPRAGLDDTDGYAAWDGEPWRDPNEVATVHAEAIENALNDDIDPGD